MAFLNYHHLRYFRAIARSGGVSKAALALSISPSALSIQLAQLEEQIGHKLFERRNRRLTLTEAGRIALAAADSIVQTGEELLATLGDSPRRRRQVLRVGAVATLSRNFQMSFLRPLMPRDDLDLILRSGTLRDLLAALKAHAVDLVLANLAAPRDSENLWHSHLLAEQPVSLIAAAKPRQAFRFPTDLAGRPLLLPSLDSNIRVAFDLLMDRHKISPIIAAEVDDMAMLRLLARDSGAVAVLPEVVVQDELREGRLQRYCAIPGVFEHFYAITAFRHSPSPLVQRLLTRGHYRASAGAPV